MKKLNYMAFIATAFFLTNLNAEEVTQGEECYAPQTSRQACCTPTLVKEEICCIPTPCCNTGGFFIRGDALYWKPHLTGLELDFGTTSIAEAISDGATVMTTSEFDEDPRLKWNVGYRVGAGYAFDSSPWEVGALWTHFQDSGRRSKSENIDIVNTTSCRIKFDQVDLILSYNDISSSFSLKPFIGVRGLRIHDGIRAFLVTDITVEPDTLATETKNLNDTQTTWSGGPLVGLNGQWDIGCGFGIYGTAAASLLYGHHKVYFDDTDVISEPFSRDISSTIRKNLHEFNWNIDLAVGISWSMAFCDSYELSAKLGFEHHQYFNQSHLGGNRGDLTFDGGVFSVNIAL